MEFIKKSSFLIFITLVLSFCVSKQSIQMDFPQEIAAVYYQKWVGRHGQYVGGTDFYIEFKKPLAKEIDLKKIHFIKQEASLKALSANVFVAHFYQLATSNDLILDSNPLKEYGNKPPIILKPKFDLEPGEAVLEYEIKNQTFFYKIISLKEKPIIANPTKE